MALDFSLNEGRGAHDASCRKNLLEEWLEAMFVDVMMGECVLL